MKVVLLIDVAAVGKRDAVKEVADGYAFNFLIPRGFAQQATPAKVAELKARKGKEEIGLAAKKKQWSRLLEGLSGKSIRLKARANEKGHLYKSVTAEVISGEIEKLHGVKIPADAISVGEPIRSVGKFEAIIKLADERAPVVLEIVAD